MQERLRGLGLVKKPVTEREKQQRQRQRHAEEAARLMCQYDRETLYGQVWAHPVHEVAKGYGISGVSGEGVPRTEHSRPVARLLGARAKWCSGEEAGVAQTGVSKQASANRQAKAQGNGNREFTARFARPERLPGA
jgi:hypothetical protein